MKKANTQENLTQEGINLQNENNRQVKEKVIRKPKDKNDGLQLSTRYEKYCFAKRHLRGEPRPEVFSFGESDSNTPKTSEEDNITRTITTTHAHSWGWNISYVINQLTNPPHSGQRVYGTDGIAPTVTTGKKVWIPEGTVLRRLTEIECERLQGFPDNWTEGISSTQRYKCLGNAVTVNVVYEAAKNL